MRTKRWLATMLAALLALAWQSLVTQAHVHFDPADVGSSAAVQGDGQARAKAEAPPSDTPSTCPICQELAHAGRYLPPDTIAWQARDIATYEAFAPFLLLRGGHGRSHAWNSRAPPSVLQA